jgi:general L-amino acid transport system permease protein
MIEADDAQDSRRSGAGGGFRWWRQVKRRLFGTWWEALLTLVCAVLIVWTIVWLARWAIIDAVWTETDVGRCAETDGACWSVIHARYRLILFGLYPYEQQWRSALSCLIVIAMVMASCARFFWRPGLLLAVWGLGSAAFFTLMKGGVMGLSAVPTDKWGGLVLTLFVYVCTILIAMPAGIALALARRSRLPAIRFTTVFLVDLVRSIPLVTVVFGVAFFAPFFLPQFLMGDKIYRVIFGFAFFYACLQAMVISGGLQSVPAGQGEAAAALGLKKWQVIALVILPQALKISLPAMINLVVMAFKDTSVLVIVGLFELTASGNIAYQSGEWSSYYTEVFVFVALIYFAFAYSLSRYGAFLEKRAQGR